MKHGLFFLVWMSLLGFLFAIAGVLALLGYWNAEVIIWTRTPIKSETGKLVWIVMSGIRFCRIFDFVDSQVSERSTMEKLT